MSDPRPSAADALPMDRSAGTKRLLLAAKIVITVGALYLAFRTVDFATLVTRLANMNVGWFIAAVFLVMMQIALVSQRWQVIVSRLDAAAPLSAGRAVAITFAGQFLNQVIPSAGDALRALLASRAGISARFAITSVLIDRGIAMLVLLVLTVPALLLLPLVMTLPGFSTTMLLTIAALLAAFVLALLFGPRLIELLPARLAMPFAAALTDTRRVLLDAATATRAGGLSLGIHLMSVAVVWTLSEAVLTPLSPLTLLVLVPPMLFATMLPFTVSGWGAREGVVLWFLSRTETPPEGALLLSVSFGAAMLVAALPGAIAWFGVTRRVG